MFTQCCTLGVYALCFLSAPGSLCGLLAALKPGTCLTEGGPFSHISK